LVAPLPSLQICVRKAWQWLERTTSEFVTQSLRHRHSSWETERLELVCKPFKSGTREQDMKATELIKRCIAVAPFFVGVIAYTLLIAGQTAPL